jgi:hypothetical protein
MRNTDLPLHPKPGRCPHSSPAESPARGRGATSPTSSLPDLGLPGGRFYPRSPESITREAALLVPRRTVNRHIFRRRQVREEGIGRPGEDGGTRLPYQPGGRVAVGRGAEVPVVARRRPARPGAVGLRVVTGGLAIRGPRPARLQAGGPLGSGVEEPRIRSVGGRNAPTGSARGLRRRGRTHRPSFVRSWMGG